MFKKILLAALLAPVLAYGGSPSTDLSVQIVPAASPPPPPPTNLTPPAPAQAAGFTTLAANYDFTGQTSDGVHPANWYQTITNWLTCVGGYTGVAPVMQTAPGPGNTNYPPCSDFNIISDGGITVLDQTYTAEDYNNESGGKAIQFQGCDTQGANCLFTLPITMYYEIIDRVTQATVDEYSSQFTILSDDWSWPTAATGGVEFDFIETYSNGTAAPDGSVVGLSWGNVPLTTYTKYGFLVTSDGTSDLDVCLFENDSLVQCADQGNSGSHVFNQRSFLINQVGPGGSDRPAPTTPMDHLIQHIRVWACSGWASGSCFGSTKYNSGGLLYWHN